MKTKILVVDDEPSVLFFIRETLLRDGHEVTSINSGEKAIECIGQQDYDLAILDIQLTGISGIDVLAYIRKYSPYTAVIVLTAHATLETSIEALRLDADDYLFKPCKLADLRNSIKQGLINHRKRKTQRELLLNIQQSLAENLNGIQSVIDFGEEQSLLESNRTELNSICFRYKRVEINLERHEIKVDDNTIELSPTEFKLLSYLTSQAPRVVSSHELAQQILECPVEIWQAGEIVRYHIYRIRKKINQNVGETNIVRNVRGIGYTLG
jgi:DNA-binding response OmpR family regulator